MIGPKQSLTIGLADNQSGITVSESDIPAKLLTVSWTGRAVEIRAAAPGIRPVVDGQPVVHARLHVGQRFSIADNVFEVSGPAQIALVPRRITAAAAPPPVATPAYHRWTIPTNQSVTIGREGGPAEIALSGLDLTHRHATVSWTGRAIEIRSTAPQARPFVNGQPVLHARIPVGGQFMIGSHTLVVSAPGEIALVPAQVTATEPVLRFADVSLQYRGRTEPTLKNLSFELARGEVLAVIGPSGAGKSTMCRGLLGEVELTSGSMVLGQVSLAASRMQASHLVSFVPQQPAMFEKSQCPRVIDVGRQPSTGRRYGTRGALSKRRQGNRSNGIDWRCRETGRYPIRWSAQTRLNRHGVTQRPAAARARRTHIRSR